MRCDDLLAAWTNHKRLFQDIEYYRICQINIFFRHLFSIHTFPDPDKVVLLEN